MKTISITCDIEGCDLPVKEYEQKDIQVIFTSEQIGGRSCKPYLSDHKIDICRRCLEKILEGNYIWAYGAQGYDHYYFKKDENI